MVQQLLKLPDEVRETRDLRIRRRTTVSNHVVRNDPQVGSQGLNLRIPHGVIEPDAVTQNQRLWPRSRRLEKGSLWCEVLASVKVDGQIQIPGLRAAPAMIL